MDDRRAVAAAVARFELRLLGELGFGLDLDRCAATGEMGDLAYVSPKSGRAVSRAAGAPWRERLLALPQFLRRATPDDVEWSEPSADELAAGFALTGYFLTRYVFAPRGEKPTDTRDNFIAAALRSTVAAPDH